MESGMPGGFDEYQGGNVKIPSTLSLQQLGQHRANEIFMLHDAIEEPPYKGQVFQRLPKHMRRRQMSHFSNRLPRNVRSVISEKNKVAPPKRPSRKYRRKAPNLLQDYIRRQREKVWLETHIWHAKRFHMEDRWGYRLPACPTNKTFRANYRASAKHCLLLDLSYHNCIELIGKEEDLLLGLQTCVSPSCGLTFSARYFLDGSREGSTVMFHSNSYPYNVIGQVSFLWKPVDGLDKRCLWLWVHPSLHDEIVECIKSIFVLAPVPPSDVIVAVEETKENSKLKARNVPFVRVPSFTSDKVTMNLLKDTLNRFRLVGPLSSSILANGLRPASHVTNSLELDVEETPAKRPRLDDSVEVIEDVGQAKGRTIDDCWKWVLDECRNGNWYNLLVSQEEKFDLLDKVTSPTQFPPHSVFSLLAQDPRLCKPVKRTKSLPSFDGGVNVPEWNADLAQSLIWKSNARDAATLNKPSTWDLNLELSKRFVPGKCTTGAVVPLLLIQRPGCRGPDRVGYSSGWDVICPAGWAMPLWTNFILHGAKPGGLRECTSVEFESQRVKNQLQPDSKAGLCEIDNCMKQKRSRFQSLPPAKRPNYIKLGIPSPFLPLWSELVQFWNKTAPCQVFVLRDTCYLRRLSETVKGSTSDMPNSDLNLSSAIVPIAISCTSGQPDQYAHLYLPTADDLAAFNKHKPAPMEKLHKDSLSDKRKTTLAAHKKMLRSERRKRKKCRASLAEEILQQPLGTQLPEGYVVNKTVAVEKDETFQNEMANMWLPSNESALTVLNNCSRRQLGYVTLADFGMTEGRGTALGYVLHTGLAELIRDLKKPLLLLRNADQTQYRFATFRIILE